MSQMLGQFFSVAEFERTSQKLDNTMPPEAIGAARQLVADVLDPLRARLGRPVRITSGFRTEAVNRAIGGSPTSDHRFGRAVDIKTDGHDARALARVILAMGLPFDQLIWYDADRGGHVHISHRPGRNRGQVLHATTVNGARKYLAVNP